RQSGSGVIAGAVQCDRIRNESARGGRSPSLRDRAFRQLVRRSQFQSRQFEPGKTFRRPGGRRDEEEQAQGHLERKLRPDLGADDYYLWPEDEIDSGGRGRAARALCDGVVTRTFERKKAGVDSGLLASRVGSASSIHPVVPQTYKSAALCHSCAMFLMINA